MFIEPQRIPEQLAKILRSSDAHDLFLSDASVWEAAMKFGLGKLKLPEDPELFFLDRVRRSGFRHLPIDLRHAANVHALPPVHGDPFDRMLVSQAIIEKLTLVSADPVFSHYGIKTMLLREVS
jgi:PIN domain nuclease of toxin-antitoxin system